MNLDDDRALGVALVILAVTIILLAGLFELAKGCGA